MTNLNLNQIELLAFSSFLSLLVSAAFSWFILIRSASASSFCLQIALVTSCGLNCSQSSSKLAQYSYTNTGSYRIIRFSWFVVTAWLVQLKLPVTSIWLSIMQYLLCMCAILLLSVVQGTPSNPSRHISAPLNLLHSSSEISLTLTPLEKTQVKASDRTSLVNAKTQTSTVLEALLIS